MPRYSIKMTRDEFEQKFVERVKASVAKFGTNNEWEFGIPSQDTITLENIYHRSPQLIYNLLNSKISKDISKIGFDFENWDWDGNMFAGNVMMGIQTLDNGFTFQGISAGGDWELPVYSIIYYDGKEFRGYVPEDGNVFNPKTRMAWGNEEDEIDELPDENYDFAKIEADIKKRIILR